MERSEGPGETDPRGEREQSLTGDRKDGQYKVIDAYKHISRVRGSRTRESFLENFYFLNELRNKVTKKHERMQNWSF